MARVFSSQCLVVTGVGADHERVEDHCRVSKCHGLTVVGPRKILRSLRKILRIVYAIQTFMHFNLFFFFFFMIHNCYVILGAIFALLFAQHFQNKSFDCTKIYF